MADKRASGLFRLLADMAENEDLLNRFKEKPSSVMDDYALTDDQKDLLSKAADKNLHDLERHAHLSKLVSDEASAKLVPFC